MTIRNDHIELVLPLPDAENGWHRGTRFDWSGLIYEARIGKHSVFGPWREKHDPTGSDHVSGPAEEFGLKDPVGYEQASPGQPFVKIGVGLLRRPDDKPYKFHRDYEVVDGGQWHVEANGDSVTYVHELDSDAGYAYTFRKRIVLLADGPGYRIERKLTNRGDKPLVTTHYNHGFISIDDTPVGPGYRLELPFAPPEDTSVKGPAHFEGRMLVIDEISKGAFYVKPSGFDPTNPDHSGFVLTHVPSGIVMTSTTDRPPVDWAIWGVREALAPEPFLAIDVPPSASMKWTTTHEFHVPSNQGLGR